MRSFIVIGHRAVTTPNFSLNDLPGSGGRMDLITRSVNAAFCISHDIRREVEITIVLLGPEDPPKSIRFAGLELKYLNPDERSTGALIRNALVKYCTAQAEGKIEEIRRSDSEQNGNPMQRLPGELNASPGIFISRNGLERVLEHYSKKSDIICLHEAGSEITKTALSKEYTFILSDDKNFTPEEEALIRNFTTIELSLGPTIIHTDHCITLLHNYLDKIFH
jgi:tRNA (pseudouridine54-N1)-methyltransferase